MDEIRKDEREEITEVETPLILNILFDICRRICDWAEVEPKDLTLLVNGLLPLEEHKGEERIRPLSLLELSAFAHIEEGGAKLLNDFHDDQDPAFQIVRELLGTLKNCLMACSILGHKLRPGQTSFHGIRRQHNRAVWVRRAPTEEERLEALQFALALGLELEEEGGDKDEPTKH